VLVAAAFLGGCASPAPSPSDARQDGPGRANQIPIDGDLPEAAPAFAAHFTHWIYEDAASEFAPFGTDEGWDLLHEWAERRDELDSNTTVADLIEASGFSDIVAELDARDGQGIPDPAGQADAATITIGAGFTLLRLSGNIDAAGRAQTLRALDILIRYYDAPFELLRQRDDLASWDG
jgi:uncharacterized protein YfeS